MTIGIFQEEAYAFPKAQQAIVGGGPGRALQSVPRRFCYGIVGLVVSITAGLGNALITVNEPYLLGSASAEPSEVAWVATAYVMGTVCMNLLLVRFRQQFGLRLYAMIGLISFSLIVMFHLLIHSIGGEILIQLLFGMATAPLLTLSVYYVMAAMPPKLPLVGVLIGLGITQLPIPLARLFSTDLLAIDQWRSLYHFELGLALVALGGVTLLRLPPSNREKVFEPLDFVTFVLMATGMALVCAALGLGTIEWWTDRTWIGWALAAAAPLLGVALLVERRRANPLIDLGFITRSGLIRYAVLAVLGRIVLADQSSAISLLNMLGVANEELHTFCVVLLVGSACGTAVSVLVVKPDRLWLVAAVAIAIVAVCAFCDSDATDLTRAPQLYLTQTMIAFAAALYIGPALLFGVSKVIEAGGKPLASFLVLFTITQNVGALAGSALLGTFEIIREKANSAVLTQHVLATDPQVTARLQAYAATLGPTLTDPAQRQGSAINLLQQQATLEANVLAYNNVFTLVAVLAALTVVLVAAMPVLRSIRRQPAADPAGLVKTGASR